MHRLWYLGWHRSRICTGAPCASHSVQLAEAKKQAKATERTFVQHQADFNRVRIRCRAERGGAGLG